MVPPGDDAAVLQTGLVLSTDTLVEGLHWDHRLSASDVAFKAVAVSASDIIAMGAEPAWMLLNFSGQQDPVWLSSFCAGLAQAAEHFSVDLIGGDTTGLPAEAARTITVTMAGMLENGSAITRSNAQPGDLICVTGHLGLAGAGYLLSHPAEASLAALRRPQPRAAFMHHARPWIRAAMDLSDGLKADLPRLCACSELGAHIQPEMIREHPAIVEQAISARTLKLAAGDDYELLFTCDPADRERIELVAKETQTPLSVIGQMNDSGHVTLSDGHWPDSPWSHFMRRSS